MTANDRKANQILNEVQDDEYLDERHDIKRHNGTIRVVTDNIAFSGKTGELDEAASKTLAIKSRFSK